MISGKNKNMNSTNYYDKQPYKTHDKRNTTYNNIWEGIWGNQNKYN